MIRGYCGIGMYMPKTEVNLGTLWRSAYCLGADFIFTIGNRYKKQCSDTTKAWRHIPYWRFENILDFRNHIPYDCQLVCVERYPSAVNLKDFKHPTRAIYVLGPEDGSIPQGLIDLSLYLVEFDSKHCLNVASAGTVVLYDRQTKMNDIAKECS